MVGPKKRLDLFLCENNFFESREKARAAVMAGLVSVDGARAQKPGQAVGTGAAILIKGGLKYVSRGGLKLEKALKSFNIDLTGLLVLDVGASTGGFTDCALQNGARGVYAVDVGYGQLAWKLRCDPRVTLLERTNIRHLEPGGLKEAPDFATIDVSFISLDKVLPRVCSLLSPGARCVALIKPQFEAGREKVGKKGVVKDPLVHVEVIAGIFKTALGQGWQVLGLDFSPVRGPEGNLEYLIYLAFAPDGCQDFVKYIISPESKEILNGAAQKHKSSIQETANGDTFISLDHISTMVNLAHANLSAPGKKSDNE